MRVATAALRGGCVACLALALGACGTPGARFSSPDAASASASVPPAHTDLLQKVMPVVPPADLWERMRRGMHWPMPDTVAVRRARDAYLTQPRYLQIIGPRAQRYLHYIVDEVESRGMPMELALLPLVESALNPFAVSPQHAAGLWQIMPATGQHLGMQRNWWFDDRLDLRRSTRVALDYLQDLHAHFDGDWMLALAAYNAGRGRVSGAQRHNAARGLPTDYWSLSLPPETNHYVPRLLALSDIVRRAPEFNAQLPPVANVPAFIAVPTGGQIELQRAAQLAGVEIATLRQYNPGHLRWATAPERHEILLPARHAARFTAALASLPEDQRVSWTHYRIRRGDSLGVIARRFATRVSLLRQVNDIDGHFIRAGDTLLIPRGGDWSGSLALGKRARDRRRQAYRVRRGDSLYRIANRFNVTIGELVDWNRIDPADYLKPGQRLTLFVDGQ